MMSNRHRDPVQSAPIDRPGRTGGGRPRRYRHRQPSLESLDHRVLLSVGFDSGTRTFTATGSNSLLLAQVDQGGTNYLAYNATPDDPNNLQITGVPISAGAITVNVDDVGQTNTVILDASWDFTAAVTFNGDTDASSIDVLDTSLLTSEAWQLTTVSDGVVSISGGLNTLSFSSVESAIGSLTGTLIGVDSPTANSTWTLKSGTAVSPHTYALDSAPGTVLNLQGFGTLQGSQAADHFAIDGDAANGTTWVAANLGGGAGDDVFAFANATQLFGNIDGGAGSDTLDYSASEFGSFVTLTAAADANGYQGTEDLTLSGYGFSGIDTLVGSGIADQLTGRDDVATWTLDGSPTYQKTGSADSPLSFSGYTVLQGGSKVDVFAISADTTADIAGGAGADVFEFHGSAVLTGSIHAYDFLGTNPGDDSGDTLDYSNYGSAVAVTLSGPATTDGYAGNEATSFAGGYAFDGIDVLTARAAAGDSLIGENLDSTWELDGTPTYQENAGVANALAIATFDDLKGGTGVDTFNITGFVTVNLDGGDGDDVFVFADAADLTGTLDGGAGTGDRLNYSAYTTAVSVNLATSAATGTDGFSNIEAMTGGIAATSTLAGADTANTWAITADNAGDINGGAFTLSQVGNLTGGPLADSFVFSDAAMLAGAIDAKGGNDTLDFSAYTTGLTATVSVTNGNTLSDGVASFGFSAIENLIGGSADDTFAFDDTGALGGTVNGGGGTGDMLDYSDYAAPVTVSLAASTATATGGFSNVEAMIGSSTQASTLAAAHKTNAWAINGADAGNINGGAFTFSQVGNLTGGILGDGFVFGAAGSLTGTLNGGSGTDTVDFSAKSADMTANITATNTGSITAGAVNFSFLGVENLIGGSGNDTFVIGGNSVSLTGTIDGKGGSNTLDYSAFTAGVRVDLTQKTAMNVKGGAANGITNIRNVIGGSGNDTLIGDAAANTLIGNGGNNVLSGLAGDDTLTGGAGRDILIGGDGADLLSGGDGEDLLISDRYTQEANITALTALMAEWGRTDANFATRAGHLDGSLAGGRNGTYKLTTGVGGTLVVDGAIDTLYGNAGLDWYLAADSDVAQTDSGTATMETIGGVSELTKKKRIF